MAFNGETLCNQALKIYIKHLFLSIIGYHIGQNVHIGAFKESEWIHIYS